MTTRQLNLVGFAVVVLAASNAYSAETKQLVFSDLRKIEWAGGGLERLRWGMSPAEAEAALGVRFRRLGPNDMTGQEACQLRLSTIWCGKRITFDEQGASGQLEFTKGKLTSISFAVWQGFEEEFLTAAFEKLGAGRCVEGRIYDDTVGGERVTSAKSTGRPKLIPEDDKAPDLWYDWVDSDTIVEVIDWYLRSDPPGKKERSITVTIKSWKTEGDNNRDPEMAKRVRQRAQSYLDWRNANQ